jgi:hypothetical protein
MRSFWCSGRRREAGVYVLRILDIRLICVVGFGMFRRMVFGDVGVPVVFLDIDLHHGNICHVAQRMLRG